MTAADLELGPGDPGRGPGPGAATGGADPTFPIAGPALVAVGMTAATYSVVRFDLRIVATYLVLLVLLLADLLRGRPGRFTRPTRPAVAGALVATGGLTWLVPGFSYLGGRAATEVRATTAAAAVLAGLALVLPRRVLGPTPGRRSGRLCLGIATLGYLAGSAAVLRGDPAPAIDVWYSLQGAADALAAGHDVYEQTWVAPPGVIGAFTYLPWTAVLLAPGRWLAGDVRITLVALTLLSAAVATRLGTGPGRSRGSSAPLPGPADPPSDPGRVGLGLAALLLLLPGTATQVEQAWTEPLLLAELACFALALTRRRPGWAIVALALALASKQHIALLLPVLAAWPGFGWRRAVTCALGAGALVLPWLLASPQAIVGDTVVLLVRFPALTFADSLYTAAINVLGWTPPFWATGVVVALALLLASSRVRRPGAGVAVVLRWCAAVLLVANLVNKQAFYNQYWLVAALVLLSWAVPAAVESGGGSGGGQHGRVRTAAADST